MSDKVKPLHSLMLKIGGALIGGAITLNFLFSWFNLSMIINVIIAVMGVLYYLIDNIFWKNILQFLFKYDFIAKILKNYEVPILKEEYVCKIEFIDKAGKMNEKITKLKIEQTYTDVKVSLSTDEIKSYTVIADIIKENGEFFLYYIYKTAPKSQYIEKNPVQDGGCKIFLDSLNNEGYNSKLSGQYWTSSKTVGDIELIEKV